MSRWDNHPPCPGGCGELADECTCRRPNLLGSMQIQPVCSTCDDMGEIRMEAQISAPGSGGWITCPDCRDLPVRSIEHDTVGGTW